MNNIRRLDKIDIPSYTFSQELFNSVSHLFGIPLGLISITIGTILYFLHGLQLIYYIGLLVFGVTTILLYLMSSLYHIETPVKESSKKIKRIVDHCTIYLLIAGTYTPICLYLNSINQIGLILLIVEWALAIIGIIINAIDLTNKFVKCFSMFLYLALGWLILFSGAFIYLPFKPFLFILLGGITYTIGSITYGIGHKNLSFHCVFHIFVLLGTILQTIGVIQLFI